MTHAKAVWTDNHCFVAESDSSHALVVDGDKKTGNSPMELVLIGLCGCTGYDVASILQKKREPFTSLEVRAEAERAKEPPMVYTAIKLIYKVSGKASRKAVEDAVRLSKEQYCTTRRNPWRISRTPSAAMPTLRPRPLCGGSRLRWGGQRLPGDCFPWARRCSRSIPSFSRKAARRFLSWCCCRFSGGAEAQRI